MGCFPKTHSNNQGEKIQNRRETMGPSADNRAAHSGNAGATHKKAKAKLQEKHGVQQADGAKHGNGKSPQHRSLEATIRACYPASSLMILPRALE